MTSPVEIPPGVLDRINNTPALLSVLYDVDLLPEQVTDETVRSMLLVVVAFDAGLAAARAEVDSRITTYDNDLIDEDKEVEAFTNGMTRGFEACSRAIARLMEGK